MWERRDGGGKRRAKSPYTVQADTNKGKVKQCLVFNCAVKIKPNYKIARCSIKHERHLAVAHIYKTQHMLRRESTYT